MQIKYLESQLIGFLTLSTKEVKRFLRIWVQTILPTPITIGLYFLIFGKVLGLQLKAYGSFSFLEFITPGLVLMAIINNSFANTVSSFFGSKFQKNIEEMLVSTMSTTTILAGFVVGGVLRGLLLGFIVFVIGFYLGLKSPAMISESILICFLTSVVFSLAGFLNGIFAKKFDDIAIIPTFFLTPMTYLGGIFYNASLLPTHLKWTLAWNPIYYIIEGLRLSMLGSGDVSIATCILLLLGLSIVLTVVNLVLLEKRVGF